MSGPPAPGNGGVSGPPAPSNGGVSGPPAPGAAPAAPAGGASAAPRAALFLLQLGGPRSLADIEPFLRNLFEDVLPLPGFLRRPLAGLIARRRTPEVTPLYQEIGGGSPLLRNTEAQAEALEARLAALGLPVKVLLCMRYAPPRAASALAYARQHLADVPWLAVSLYPQYSFATSRSSLRELEAQLQPHERPRLRALCAYPEHPGYLDAVAAGIDASLAELAARQPAVPPDEVHLVFSAHGLPLKLVREGDPYPQHIEATVGGVLRRLRASPKAHTLCYQSRVGPVKWLTPPTLETVRELGAAGERHLLMVPIAFTSEHIETLHEIDIQLQQTAREAGVTTYARVPTVGTQPQFIDALAQLVRERLAQPTRCCGLTPQCDLAAQPAQPC